MSDPLMHAKDFFDQHKKQYGTVAAGAAFGMGWWVYIDAAALSSTHIRFIEYLPGIFASFALILINAVRWDEIQTYDPWGDEGVYCRSRVWLLIAYIVCAGSIAGAGSVMIASGGGAIGMAAVAQVTLIICGALLFFVSRSEGEGGDGYGSLL